MQTGFGLSSDAPAQWESPAVANALKLAVVALLLNVAITIYVWSSPDLNSSQGGSPGAFAAVLGVSALVYGLIWHTARRGPAISAKWALLVWTVLAMVGTVADGRPIRLIPVGFQVAAVVVLLKGWPRRRALDNPHEMP